MFNLELTPFSQLPVAWQNEVNYTSWRKLATGYCCDINICDWASYVACYHIIVFMSTAFLVRKTAVMSLQLDTLCFTTLGIDITFRTTSQTLHVYERNPLLLLADQV